MLDIVDMITPWIDRASKTKYCNSIQLDYCSYIRFIAYEVLKKNHKI